MKARSVVFTHLERPMTIFGLPAKMFGATMIAAVLTFMGTVIGGAIPFSMLATGLVVILGLGACYRARRHDHHIETLALTTLAFWRGRCRRYLLAGASADASSPSRKRKGHK